MVFGHRRAVRLIEVLMRAAKIEVDGRWKVRDHVEAVWTALHGIGGAGGFACLRCWTTVPRPSRWVRGCRPGYGPRAGDHAADEPAGSSPQSVRQI